MGRKNKIFTYIVGYTSSEKVICFPYDLKTVDDFVSGLIKTFDWQEIFEVYAIAEYLVTKELRKDHTQSQFFAIYQSVSTNIYGLLVEKQKLYEVLEGAEIRNSIDVLKIGESLVLPEFKRI